MDILGPQRPMFSPRGRCPGSRVRSVGKQVGVGHVPVSRLRPRPRLAVTAPHGLRGLSATASGAPVPSVLGTCWAAPPAGSERCLIGTESRPQPLHRYASQLEYWLDAVGHAVLRAGFTRRLGCGHGFAAERCRCVVGPAGTG